MTHGVRDVFTSMSHLQTRHIYVFILCIMFSWMSLEVLEKVFLIDIRNILVHHYHVGQFRVFKLVRSILVGVLQEG